MQTGDASDPAADRIFDALRTYHRRRLLRLLAERREDELPLDLRETVPKRDDERTYLTRMTHQHLPKLADYGYVDYDREHERIEPGARFDEVTAVVELLLDDRRRLPMEFP
ncbi:transcriptional regulator [Halosimplex pelagicum]|uniref:Transcriptional regulator n=1 Tax=Halosimplex pelagicum TaxID=869886 RepID=A0A7D5T843_9EURY|nr:transcriptional regulator [Halosimplex pelagicum]QLH80630.1 transcriptional regulator [Halosimplex pelagicum]